MMVLNIKNKVKREQVFRKQRREHTQAKLKARIERAELEKKDPALKAVSFSTALTLTIAADDCYSIGPPCEECSQNARQHARSI